MEKDKMVWTSLSEQEAWKKLEKEALLKYQQKLLWDMEENKYFTPDIEDIRVGYELEWLLNDGLKHVWKPIVAGLETGEIIEKAQRFGIRFFRVPYLTKEQIEADGWKYKGKTMDIWFEKEIDYDMGSWTAYKVVMQYGLEDHRLRIFAVDRVDKLEYDCFRGICKSINEFRYIMKLLNI